MLKIVKDSVLKVTRSFGYDIVPPREMKERDFSLHLRELLMRLDVDCVLDVGANTGQYQTSCAIGCSMTARSSHSNR